MKSKLRMLSMFLFFGLLFVLGNTKTVKAEDTKEYLTVKYYVDSVEEINLIGQQQVAYPGLVNVKDVSELRLDETVVQAYHAEGKKAEFYRSGKVVSYDASTQTACVLYEMVTYTIEFYQDSVDGTSLGTATKSGYVGSVITDRMLGKELRNTYRPESGYLSGKVYQTVTLADADDNVVKVLYRPVVEQSKIYFYNVCGSSDFSSDAILIESNGHFGLVDCGEDLDYPDGSNPKYPARDGIATLAYANPQDLIDFISAKGVTELDFIIFTHAHSDHMGAADEIMAAFDVGTVYAREYDDKYISDENRLWDTQYVYDCMVNAATKYGITLIQDFNEENTGFQFQDLKIQLKNYETDYDGDSRQAKWDDNENSLGVLVTDSYENKIFLAGDIDNIDGDEDKLAQDEELQNVTVLKLAHHGFAHSSTTNFLKALNPSYVVITNSQYMMDQNIYNQLVTMGKTMYFVQSCKEGITLEVPQIRFTKEQEFSGWTYDKGLNKNYYYVDGAKLRDCETLINGKTYRFYKDGAAYSLEWYQDESTGDWYYYGKDYARVEDDWMMYQDKYYHFDKEGRMQSNMWLTVKDQTYYLQEDGVRAAGDWFKIDGKYYYFDADGVRAESDSWLQIGNDWYYLNTDFSRKDNCWITDKEKTYYFDKDGKMVAAQWVKRDDKWYYLQKNGAMYQGTGWWQLDKKWYYLAEDSSRLSGDWVLDGGSWYYMDKDGVMLSNEWGNVSGRWYYFKSSGAMVSDGWYRVRNKWYYFEKNGAMYENSWIHYKKDWYYMGKDGAMVTSNWANVDGVWYYFDMNGIMLSEQWGYIGGKWYYFGKSGAMYESQWLKYKGSWYYFKSSGEMMASGWLHDGGNWYYLQADGTMAVNTTINGKYQINKQGVWVK
ncbi:MAG: MBL fold metallo-hydrolase [Lachnospiraceae bacterium]|nr:MBL fold metallo-hydrolase [Lachnospiraceae bacterium]